MTKKEQREMRKLEIRIEELERCLKTTSESWRDQVFAIADAKIAMRQAYESLFDALFTLQRHMAADPAFMQLRGELANDMKLVG